MKRSKPINSSSAKPSPRNRRQTLGELRALQRLMATAVMRPLTPAWRMRKTWLDERPTSEVAASFIKPNQRLTSFDRLEIYNRQYWLRVLECFYDDYPGVRAVLGKNRFRDLAIAYLANHPSTRFTLRDLGRHLVEFMQQEPRWTTPQTELALNMARLEWAHIVAFDGEAKTPLSPKDLTGGDEGEVHLLLQPYITLLELAYPLDEYLIVLRDRLDLREEASNAMGKPQAPGRLRPLRLPKRRTIRVAVHRHQNVVYYKRLEAWQYDLLQAIHRGDSLADALRLVDGTTAARLQKWFRNWAALGWFQAGKTTRS